MSPLAPVNQVAEDGGRRRIEDQIKVTLPPILSYDTSEEVLQSDVGEPFLDF